MHSLLVRPACSPLLCWSGGAPSLLQEGPLPSAGSAGFPPVGFPGAAQRYKFALPRAIPYPSVWCDSSCDSMLQGHWAPLLGGANFYKAGLALPAWLCRLGDVLSMAVRGPPLYSHAWCSSMFCFPGPLCCVSRPAGSCILPSSGVALPGPSPRLDPDHVCFGWHPWAARSVAPAPSARLGSGAVVFASWPRPCS